MMMAHLERLRARWGGQLRPSAGIQPSFIERWDGAAEGRAKALVFEGFGLSAILVIGPTPPEQVQ
jgi:hypothetical protein